MNRQDFVKSLLTLSGTAFVYGCKDALDLTSIDPQHHSPLDPLEAKDWFQNSYLPLFQKSSARTKSISINRSLDWDKGVKIKKNAENFIWVPITYVNPKQLPTLVTWKDGQEYIPKLAEFLKWSIAEGFIVYKDKKGNLKGSIVQIAYDPFKHKPGKAIDSNHFTGMIIHAEWDENPLRVWRYLDGQLESHFDSENTKGAKLQECRNVYYSYQTYSGQSCGPNCSEFTVTLHREVYTICDNTTSGGDPNGSGSQGYPYYSSGGSGGGDNGNGTITPPVSSVYTPYIRYDYGKLSRHEGEDYQIFMQRLNITLTTLNISATTFGMSYTYADVFVKTLGMEDAWVSNVSKTLSSVSRVIGVAGLVVGGVQLGIGLADGDVSQADMLNAFALVLAGVAVFTPIGWIALTAGGVSACIGFYTSVNP